MGKAIRDLPNCRQSWIRCSVPIEKPWSKTAAFCWIGIGSPMPLSRWSASAASGVLEPYAGKRTYAHHGQRVVMGQRLMQPASDQFLGWVTLSHWQAVLRPTGARCQNQAIGGGARPCS
jgi:hypothetical protein